MITPRVSNRAPSVTAGSAIHITAGESAAPVSAMLAAIITPLIAHPTAAQRCAMQPRGDEPIGDHRGDERGAERDEEPEADPWTRRDQRERENGKGAPPD